MISIVSRFVGLGREVVIANNFGASKSLDLYLLALSVPAILIALFTYSLPFTLIPMFFRVKEDSGKEDAWKFGWNLLNHWVIVLLLLCLAIFVFAGPILEALYPSVQGDDFEHTKYLLRALCAAVFGGGIFAVLRTYFHIQKRFILPAVSPFLLNASVIVSILVFSESIGGSAIAWGLVIGYGLQSILLALFLGFKRLGYSLKALSFDRHIRSMGIALLTVFGIESLGHLYTLVDRVLAAGLPEGSVSALSYSYTIFTAPVAFIGLSLGVVVLPLFSELSAKGDIKAFERPIKKAFLAVLGFILPITILLFFGADVIVELLYERGKFTAAATETTASVLKFYSIGLPAIAVHVILMRIFYSLNLRRILLLTALTSFILKFALSFMLVGEYAINGLAVATAITFTAVVLFLFGYLRWKLGLRILAIEG